MSAEYTPFKMTGHSLPGPNQRSSPAKQSEHFGIPKSEQTRKQKREVKQHHKEAAKQGKGDTKRGLRKEYKKHLRGTVKVMKEGLDRGGRKTLRKRARSEKKETIKAINARTDIK